MQGELLLKVVGQKELGRGIADETLAPTELFARHEQTEEGYQPVEHPATPKRPEQAKHGSGEKEPDRRPFDDPVFLHDHAVPLGIPVSQPHHGQDPSGDQ